MQSAINFQAICVMESNKQIDYPGAGNNSQFIYDPFGKNRKILETVSGSIVDTKQFIWIGDVRREERDGSGVITRQFFTLGQINSGLDYYYFKDHLSSIREVTNGTGNVVSQLNYDDYGRCSVTTSTFIPDFQYAGYYIHSASNLSLTRTRVYSSSVARWLSRDALFAYNQSNYVENSPITHVDPSGLQLIRIDDPSVSPLHGYIGYVENGVAYLPGIINCIGYASGAGMYIQPSSGGSVQSMMESLGFKCREVSSSKCCTCPPGSRKVVIFTSNFSGQFGPGTDVHAFTEESAGDWTYVPNNQGTAPGDIHHTSDPDSYWGPLGPRPPYEHEYCCCN